MKRNCNNFPLKISAKQINMDERNMPVNHVCVCVFEKDSNSLRQRMKRIDIHVVMQ